MIKRLFSSFRTLPTEQMAKYGVYCPFAYRNLSEAEILEQSVLRRPSCPFTRTSVISVSGALCAWSGEKTGRSPTDKRIVLDEITEKDVDWGDVNMPMDQTKFDEMETLAKNYLSNKDRIFVVDGYVGYDPKYRYKVRVFCTRSYHALFMLNMLIRPTEEELNKDFNKGIDFVIYNAGEFYAPVGTTSPGSATCITFDLNAGKGIILGTQYAGCMKKGMFTFMHYFMPKRGQLSLHSSATEGREKGDTALLFGLSGTGKTTLSADPKRLMIGDDEHVWSDDGIFNIEGGIYAKTVNLTKESEPDIFNAIRFGAVLENIEMLDNRLRIPDYTNTSITENTRCSFPIEYMPNAKIPCMGGHPENVIFLTCDAGGVFPPISRLTKEQAMYHFMSGYTAKVAGTEVGVKEPVATFSACFGEAFIPLHPSVYAELLAVKVEEHNTKVWLVNTGWVGGKYGEGKRISLKHTRAILDAIYDGSLDNATYETMPLFNLEFPTHINNVPSDILNPRNSWSNKETYDLDVKKLAGEFIKNFKRYVDKTDKRIIDAGPVEI